MTGGYLPDDRTTTHDLGETVPAVTARSGAEVPRPLTVALSVPPKDHPAGPKGEVAALPAQGPATCSGAGPGREEPRGPPRASAGAATTVHAAPAPAAPLAAPQLK